MVLRIDKYEPLVRVALDEAARQGFYAIVRVEDREDNLISLTNKTAQQKVNSDFRGMGITVFTDEGACAHGSTDVMNEQTIKTLVQSISADARASSRYGIQINREVFSLIKEVAYEEVPVRIPIGEKSLTELEQRLMELHADSCSLEEKMSVTTQFLEQNEHWYIARTDGTDVRFSMPMSRIFQQMTLREGEKAQAVSLKIPGVDAHILYAEEASLLYHHRSHQAVELVKQFIHAQQLPAGSYKALLTSNFSGLLAHEAVGHPAESDLVRTSILGRDGKLKIGELVSPENISFVDGPVEGLWGDVRYSMNGTKRKEVAFIKDGRIADSLSDIFSAKDVGTPMNGCDRAQTFHHVTIPRMSNTRIVDSCPYPTDADPDYTTPEELYHLLCKMGEMEEPVVVPVLSTGGSVAIEEGNFMFGCAGIYMIEPNGKITMYGASSFGGTTLGAISTRMRGIGRLMAKDIGVCGKNGQGAPVSLGSHAYLLFDKTEAVKFGGR